MCPGRRLVGVWLALTLLGCTSGGDPTVAAATPAQARSSDVTPSIAAPPTSVPMPTPLTIPPTPTPLPVVSRTLLFSGDVLSHEPVIAAAATYGGQSDWPYDYRPMFADVADRVGRADLAICVLETPVSPDDTGLAGYPTFNAPRRLPDALIEAGYDGCSTASNHSMDRGPRGVAATLDQMDRVALGHAGMARSADEAERPRVYELDGIRVGHLSYTYGLNGFVLPADQPYLVNVNDVDAILQEAERARAAGADLVVLSIQWGNEYQQAPSDEQLFLADRLTGSGALDLIIGNHVHVVQPAAIVNDVAVVYGLGNSLSNQSDNCCRVGTQDGVMFEVTIEGNSELGYEVGGLAFAPTWVDRSTFTIIDLIAALEDPTLDPGLRSVYETSFNRTVEAVHSLGWELPLAE